MELGNERVWRGRSGTRGRLSGTRAECRVVVIGAAPISGVKGPASLHTPAPRVAHLQLQESPSPGPKEGCVFSHLPHQVVENVPCQQDRSRPRLTIRMLSFLDPPLLLQRFCVG